MGCICIPKDHICNMYANDPTVYVKSLQNVEAGHYTGIEEDLMFTHVKSMKIMLGTTF